MQARKPRADDRHSARGVARWLLEIGTFLLRTESELVLKSRRVIPGHLADSGFEFKFPRWPDAAKELCERWRAPQRRGDD